MKAIRVQQFGGPEVLRLAEVPTPRPGPGQVLVRVRAVGVNPVETYQRSGSNPNLALPWTPGMDAAGTIEATGPDVRGAQPGDRVYTSDTLTGSYAEFTLCEERQTHRLPPGLTFEQGAAINIPYARLTARFSIGPAPSRARRCSSTAPAAGWASRRPRSRAPPA